MQGSIISSPDLRNESSSSGSSIQGKFLPVDLLETSRSKACKLARAASYTNERVSAKWKKLKRKVIGSTVQNKFGSN